MTNLACENAITGPVVLVIVYPLPLIVNVLTLSVPGIAGMVTEPNKFESTSNITGPHTPKLAKAFIASVKF